MGKLPFAVQLYTVRDHLDKDIDGTLAKVREAGYEYVEAGGTHGLLHEEFAGRLKKAGLAAMSVHTGYDAVTKDTASVVDLARLYGVRFAVIGGIDSRLTPDRQGWANCGRSLDEAGARLQELDITLCYHNHNHEFKTLDGEYPLDILLGAAQPRNLCAQIDTFWVQYADVDPVAVITKHAGRCPLLHVKDMKDAQSKAFAEMGEGILDWPAIFRAAAAAGTQWYIVEQDTCERDSLESIRISAQFMARQ